MILLLKQNHKKGVIYHDKPTSQEIFKCTNQILN